MNAARTDKIILIFCEYKNHSKENNSTSVSDILNHSQENFFIEIKRISWSGPDPIFFKNKYPKPILIQKKSQVSCSRDDHYLVFRLDIRQDS